MKIEHVLFLSGFFFQKYGSMYQKVIFNVFTRADFGNQQKSDRVNGPLVGILHMPGLVDFEFGSGQLYRVTIDDYAKDGGAELV